MSQVGNFPGLNAPSRRTVRSPINPIDKSTVVSIYPRLIHEIKPTIEPGVFHLEPGSVQRPTLLVVGPSSWWKEIDDEQPLLEIINSSVQVAASIVRDYTNGLLGCNMNDCMPGIFWVPGEHSIKTIKEKFEDQFNDAIARQKFYYNNLIKMADILWAKTNGNPLVISEDMRIAAREMGQLDKDWNRRVTMQELTRCIACGTPRNPDYPVCAVCRTVNNVAQAKALGIIFAAETTTEVVPPKSNPPETPIQ